MKINEVTSNLNTYEATVRIVLRNRKTMVKTHVIADGIHQARMLLMHLYGENNVLSVQTLMIKAVKEGTKTLTASELQVKSLSDRAKQLTQQAKQLKARQDIAHAISKLNLVSK